MFYYYLISLILLIIGLTMLIIMWLKNKYLLKKDYKLCPRTFNNYAILIPARNEANVIENLLISLECQTSLHDTYVIVESLDDPTCDIVNKHHGNIILRTNMKNRHRKGYALDDAIKYILDDHHYDLYFIFDADNVLNTNYIDGMLKIYEQGYDMATGYRGIKNNVNVVTTCSGLIFTLINTLINQTRNKLHRGIILSGTGFFISGNLIELWHGFPFNSLTEDYELSLYASANNLKTFYNKEVAFFDEQPTNMKQSITQRTRWVKGFFEARKKRLKDIKNDYSKIIGVTPYIFILLSFIIAMLTSLFLIIIKMIQGKNYLNYLNYLLGSIIILYVVLLIFSIILILKEKNKINISLKQKLAAILFNPIFILSFINCLIKSFKKEIKWESIKHGN